MRPDAEPTATLIDSVDTDPGTATVRLRVLVFSGESLTVHPLPQEGELAIGRAEECHLQIDVPALSRRHALLRIGPPLTVEDLGSVNGTRVRGQRLAEGERATLRPGDSIDLGQVTLVLQRVPKAELSARPRRLWTHGYFEGRVEEECVRAENSGVGFAVARLKLNGTASPSAAQEALAELLDPSTLVAAYGPGEYELLIQGGKLDPLGKLADELARRGLPVTAGVALWGKDGKDPDVLLGEANARVEAQGKSEAPGLSAFVVKDPQMEALHALVRRVAQGNISVLLLGETGVGKEIFAEAIHQASPRSGGQLLRLNCAAFTETLLESELFGHEKGAFTGAVKTKIGLLESAQGGTVLLDEIGEMPLSTQAKLLRVLEQKEVLRVGDVRPRPIDVRFIAATHRDLEARVQQGTFRQDLYFRLNGITLVIPPLRERLNELDALARFFIGKAAKQFQKSEPSVSPEAMQLLRGYRWPGNLRELRNVIERAVLLSSGPVLTPEDLPVEKLTSTPLANHGLGGVARERPSGGASDHDAERAKIIAALEANGGNQTLAARALGISRRTMLNRLDAYAIPRPRKGKG